MQREEAEKLLAVMVFDELSEASKAELLAYLETDDELRERLADLRMAVKVAGDALHSGPEPVLDAQHLKRLEKLARQQSTRRLQIIRLFPKVAVAAVVFLVAGVVPFLTPQLNSQRYSMRAPQVTERPSARKEYDDFLPLSLLKERADQTAGSAGTLRATRPDDLNGPGSRQGESNERLLKGRSTTQPGIPRFGSAPAGRPALVTANDPVEARTKLASPVTPAPEAAGVMTEHDLAYGEMMNYDVAYGGGTELERVHETEPQRLYRIESGKEDVAQAVNGRGQYGYGWFDQSRPLNEAASQPRPVPTLGLGSADDRRQFTVEAESPVALGRRVDASDTPTQPASLSLRATEGVEAEAWGRRERGVAQQVEKLSALGDTPQFDSLGIESELFESAAADGSESSLVVVKQLPALKAETEPMLRGSLSEEGASRTSGSTGHGRGFGLDSIETMDGGLVATDGEDAYRSLAMPESQLSSVAQSDKSDKGTMAGGGGLGGGGFGGFGTGTGGMVAQDLSLSDVKQQITEGIDLGQTQETVDHFYYLKEANREVDALAELAKQSKSLELQPSASRPETREASAPQSGRAGELSLGEPAATPQQRVREAWGFASGLERATGDRDKLTSGSSAESEGRAKGLERGFSVPTGAAAVEDLKASAGLGNKLRFDVEHGVTLPVSGRGLAPIPEESLKEEASGRTAFTGAIAAEKTVEEIVPALDELSLNWVQDESKALIEKPSEPRPQVLIETSIVDSETDASPAQNQSDVLRSDFFRRPTSSTSQPVEDIELPPSAGFKSLPVNPWVLSAQDRLSTFGLDVDTASYTLCRRYINAGYRPPIGAVRMEEFINAFDYQYPQQDNAAFAIHAQAANAPFARPGQNLTLLKIGVKARTVGRDQQKPAHLVMVVDASASMGQADRLPLVQLGLNLLVGKLSPADRVTVIACADEARLLLEGASAQNPERIRAAINAIQPAGTTNLLAGLKLGYATARRHFKPNQVNHVLLCSDGVANVGQTEADAILAAVEADRKQGITLTCVGVGFGSYNDTLLEALANRGDGSYLFLDAAAQVEQVLVAPLTASLQGVAKDARIQVDFNPQRVRRYRLIGYENRDIEDKRFRDDTVDAAEVGSGQCSTALYELELIGDPQADLGRVYVRYLDVDTNQFQEISKALSSRIIGDFEIEEAPRFYLAAGAATFAEWLRRSEHARYVKLRDVLGVISEVRDTLTLDKQVAELADLIQRAEHLPQAP